MVWVMHCQVPRRVEREGNPRFFKPDPDVAGVEMASGSIAGEHPRAGGIGGGLAVGDRLADRVQRPKPTVAQTITSQ